MQFRSFFLGVSFMTACVIKTMAGGGTIVVPSLLKSATVFPAGAEMVHTATAVLAAGNNELAIDDIGNHVQPGSIRISSTGDLTILSVAFALTPASVGPALQKMRDSVESIKQEQARLDIQIRSDNELLELLRANKS